MSATVRSDQGTRGRRRPRSQPGKGIQLQLLQPIINVGSKSKDGLKLILPRMRTFKRIEAAFKRTPPRTRVSVKLKSAGEEDVGKCCHLVAKEKTPKPEFSSQVRCHGLISSHRVTKSLALVLERAPRPVNHCPGRPVVSLRLLGGSRPDQGEPDQEAAKLTHNPLPNSSGFLQLASIFPG